VTVLFVCIHNSARSQMAEAFVNARRNPNVRAYSAGLEKGQLNPLVVRAMAEIGIDISRNRTKTVDDAEIRGRDYDYVITVCDESGAETCPVHPSRGARLHWSFPDPSTFAGSEESRLERIRRVRDAIRLRVEAWLGALAAAQ
jgi:arsenate reductase